MKILKIRLAVANSRRFRNEQTGEMIKDEFWVGWSVSEENGDVLDQSQFWWADEADRQWVLANLRGCLVRLLNKKRATVNTQIEFGWTYDCFERGYKTTVGAVMKMIPALNWE